MKGYLALTLLIVLLVAPSTACKPAVETWVEGYKSIGIYEVTVEAPSKAITGKEFTVKVTVSVHGLNETVEAYNLTIQETLRTITVSIAETGESASKNVDKVMISVTNLTLGFGAPSEYAVNTTTVSETFTLKAPDTPGSYTIKAEAYFQADIIALFIPITTEWKQTAQTTITVSKPFPTWLIAPIIAAAAVTAVALYLRTRRPQAPAEEPQTSAP